MCPQKRSFVPNYLISPQEYFILLVRHTDEIQITFFVLKLPPWLIADFSVFLVLSWYSLVAFFSENFLIWKSDIFCYTEETEFCSTCWQLEIVNVAKTP